MENITSNVVKCDEINAEIIFHTKEKKPYHSDIDTEDTAQEYTSDDINENKWTSVNNRITKYSFDQSVSVFDVVAYILKQSHPLTTMKLQKLVYYCQAWSLVWDENPLFIEDIEAWANGPVIRDLFYFHQGIYLIDNIQIGNPDILSKEHIETINAVLDYYGDKSPQWLIDLTHMESPWRTARKRIPATTRGHKIIPLDLIADYYSSITPD